MLVRDLMVYNVITVPSDTYVLDAERIMEVHRIGRLPVVDKGELVGMVTKDDLIKASPSSTQSLDQRQLFQLLAKLRVGEIMKRDVITTTPDATVEKAVAIAQKNRVGCLPVLEGKRVVGIITGNDVFYKVVNPILGVGSKGSRIIVEGAGDVDNMQKVFQVVSRLKKTVESVWTFSGDGAKELVIQLKEEDLADLLKALEEMGYKARKREFSA
jgi:acetoin utilization protein AcuB